VSRIGKNPVAVPSGVEVAIAGQAITIKGKLGELNHVLADEVEVSHDGDEIWIKPRGDDRRSRAMWGTGRSVVQSMVRGVSEGFTRTLEINGVGYRAAVDGSFLNLQLGYSHDIKVAIPSDITIKCERPTLITVSGYDRQRVGQIAAEIRSFRKPEPYKGKGIRYAGEYVRRKEGKKK
jgi:large subunit ribosomal protein L6